MTLKPKPPGSHANYIERRGAVLRDTVNKMTTDIDARVDEHGHKDPLFDTKRDFVTILAEAVFAGNALFSISRAICWVANSLMAATLMGPISLSTC